LSERLKLELGEDFYADAGPTYINAGHLLFTRRETGIKARQQSWNKMATRGGLFNAENNLMTK